MVEKITWSPQAVESFGKIIEYIAAHWGEKSAHEFGLKTSKAIGAIFVFPEMFIKSPKKKHYYKAVITHQTSLIYHFKARKKEVELITFLDNRMKPGEYN